MTNTASTFESIPVVDLSSLSAHGSHEDLAHELTRICHEVGFFIITNHGIEQSLIDDVFSLMGDFFALDDDQKMLIDKRKSPHFRGWESVGSELTNNRVDVREQIDMWSQWDTVADVSGSPALRLLGPNQWMPTAIVADHRARTLHWMTELGELADRILELLAVGLGLDAAHFRAFFGDKPMSLTKMINYPPTPVGSAGVNAHHDTGFLTLLAPGPVAGLEVCNPDGEWIAVPTIPGSFVVNLGEMLQAMTSNYFVATPHRVIAPERRMSAAYFHGPSLDAALHPLELDPRFADAVAASDRHAGAWFMASTRETDRGVADMASQNRADTYGDQLWRYFARSYPDNMSLHHADLA